MHLGHVLTCNLMDNADILKYSCDLCEQANLFRFGFCDPVQTRVPVCPCIAALWSLNVVKLNTSFRCVLLYIGVHDVFGHLPLIAILVLFIMSPVVYVCIMCVFNASVSCISLLVVAIIFLYVQFFVLLLSPFAILLDTT